MAIVKTTKRNRIKKRIRSRIFGIAEKPRVSVFRSNKYISAQFIDDNLQKTLFSFSSKDLKEKITFTQKAKKVGEELSKIAKKNNVQKIVFDRNGYIYTGKVKALAEGLREGGIEF